MPTTFGPLQTMKRAYQHICTGEEPWIALGNFRNAWYGYAKDIRADLVNEPLLEPEQETEHTRHWGAFCAASVEFLCDRYGVACPEWVYHPCYTLTAPWYGETRDPTQKSVLQYLIETSPVPFARRNVFCGNRLFQNKYEMSAWVQEARTQGITDPGQIWHYAHQKEISIHGG